MKRLLSTILLITIIASFFTTVSFATPREMDVNDKIGLLQTVEILDQSDLSELDQPITRGEFIKLLTKFMNIEVANCDERFYIDIEEGDELWDITAQLVKNGILTISDDRRFRPNDVINHKEAACALMKGYGAGVMDYEMYTEIAIQLDLFEKVAYGNMKYKDAINLFYNAFVGRPLTFTGKGMGPGDKTFMEINHDMFYISGIANAVNESAIDGGPARFGSIRVGDLTIDCEEDNLYQYLGKGVGAFYKSEDEPELVYLYTYTESENIIELTEKNEPEFDAETFTLKYYNENERLKKIQLPQSVNVIRNGENITSDVAGAFDDFNIGKITIMSVGGSKYGTVIIDSYYNISVMSVSQSEDIIYGKDGTAIDVSDDSKPISIEDENGNKLSIDQITNNSIASVFESSVYLRIVISNEVAAGTISKVDNDENVKLTVSGTEYELFPGKELSYDLGNDVVLHLDAFGYVFEISTERKDGMKYGWIVKYKVLEIDGYDRVRLEVFTEDGTFKKIILPEKIRIDGTLRKTPDLQIFGLEQGKTSVVDQLILFKADENDMAQEIDTVYQNASGGGLFKEFNNAEGTYGSSSVGKLIWASTSTIVFVLPSKENREVEDAYAIGTRSLLEAWKTNEVDSYRSSDKDKPAAAEVLILHRDLYDSASEQRGTYVVNNKYSIWNEQEYEAQNIVTMMNGSSTVEFVLSDNFTDMDNLVKGNIVTIGLNGKKELATATLHYGTDGKGNSVKTMKEIGGWGDSNHYVAIGKVIAVGDEYADLSITGDDVPTLRFPISTTNIGVFEPDGDSTIRVGTKGDIAEAMMRGGIVAVTMYRGTMVSIAIVK